MTINTDSYYEIGAGHKFCQDYADTGRFATTDNLYHYAVVSDGCSGSVGSDIGSRFMAKMFPTAVKSALAAQLKLEPGIRNFYALQIPAWAQMLNVPTTSFDATLVALLYDQANDTLHSFIWGDGKVFYRFREGGGHLIDASYVKNAPFYLSYLTSPEREIRYEALFGTMYADVVQYTVTEDKAVFLPETTVSRAKLYSESLPKASELLGFASVFTDGIDTYHKKSDQNVIMPRHNVLNQLTQYKNVHGEFVQRRMLNVKKFCEKEEWQHFDDVSVATMTFIK